MFRLYTCDLSKYACRPNFLSIVIQFTRCGKESWVIPSDTLVWEYSISQHRPRRVYGLIISYRPNDAACQSDRVIIANCGYIVFVGSGYLWLASTLLPYGEIPWIQMHGLRFHMGGRTGEWMEGCEDECVYGWVERVG